jgi:hypothetical protein
VIVGFRNAAGDAGVREAAWTILGALALIYGSLLRCAVPSVPARCHTYYALGAVAFGIAYCYHSLAELNGASGSADPRSAAATTHGPRAATARPYPSAVRPSGGR